MLTLSIRSIPFLSAFFSHSNIETNRRRQKKINHIYFCTTFLTNVPPEMETNNKFEKWNFQPIFFAMCLFFFGLVPITWKCAQKRRRRKMSWQNSMISWMHKVISSKIWDKHLLLWLNLFSFFCVVWWDTYTFLWSTENHFGEQVLSTTSMGKAIFVSGTWYLIARIWFYQPNARKMKRLRKVNMPMGKVKVSKIRWMTPYQVTYSYSYWYRLSFKQDAGRSLFYEPPKLICFVCIGFNRQQ